MVCIYRYINIFKSRSVVEFNNFDKYTVKRTKNTPIRIYLLRFWIFLRTFLQIYSVINNPPLTHTHTHNTAIVANIMVFDWYKYIICIEVDVSRVCSMFRRLVRKKHSERGFALFIRFPVGRFLHIKYSVCTATRARTYSSCGVTAASIRHTW